MANTAVRDALANTLTNASWHDSLTELPDWEQKMYRDMADAIMPLVEAAGHVVGMWGEGGITGLDIALEEVLGGRYYG